MLFIDYRNITDLDFKIVCPWIDGSHRNLYQRYRTLHTGVDITANRVYAYSQGVVVGIGMYDDTYSVTVQFDAENIFRYCHLKSVDVSVNDIIQAGDLIGLAKKHLHFEWARKEATSKFSVWVGEITYYKQDPERLFSGEIVLKANDWSRVTENEYGYNDGYDLTPAMSDEFEVDNRDYDGGD